MDEVDIASKVSSLQIVNGCIVRKLAGILKENVTLREIDNKRESNHQEYLLKKVRFRQLAAGLLDWLDIGFLFVRTQSRRKPRQLGTKEGVAASSLNFGARIISCLSSQHYAYDQENKLVNMLIAPNSNKTLSFCPL